MPNAIKYSTTGDTQSLKKGNFFFGVGDVGKGPSSATAYYNGVTPMSGGYTIYYYNVNETSKTSFYNANSDLELITYTNGVSGQNFTTSSQCLNWFATQTNYVCVNVNYPPIITNGLVLNLDAGFIPSYPTNGTTTYDLSYGNNNGTLINGVSYSVDNGGTFVFDGADDYISVPNFNLTNVTIDVWFKKTSGTSWQGLLGNWNDGGVGDSWLLTQDTSNRVAFYIVLSNGGFDTTNDSTTTISNDVWYNYIGTFGNSTLSLYRNGSLVSSKSTSLNALYQNILNIWVGRFSDTYFSGQLPVGRVYNRALTSSEVLQNYNAGLSRFNTSNIVKDNLILDLNASNAVSYPTTGTVWRDLSGNGNKGTLTNGPTFDSTSKSIVFDGIDDFMISNISSKDLDGDPSFTVDMFVKRNQGTNIGPSYGFWGIGGAGQGNSVQGWTPTQNLIHLDVYDSTRIATSEYYPENQYIHLVWTKNGPGQETTNVKCYINGVEKTLTKTRNETRPNQFNTSTNGVGICLGRINGDSPTYYSPVTVNSFRVYKKALSESEILQNYYKSPIVTSGLVMTLDSGNVVSYPGSGTSWKDLTSNANNVTLVNGPTFNSNNGGSIVLDGTDDYIVSSNLPTNSPLSFSNGNFTIEHWIKITSYEPGTYFGLTNMIMSKGPASTYNYATQVTNSTTLSFIHRDNSEGLVFLNFTVPTLTNNITQIVFSITLTQVSLYLNGMLSETKNLTGNPITPYSYDELVIGGMYSTSNTSFTGDMYIHRIYNKPLSNNEVSQNYNATKSRFGL